MAVDRVSAYPVAIAYRQSPGERSKSLNNLADQLRLDTANAHAELDSLPGLSVLMAPGLTLSIYQASLLRLHAAWAPVETALEMAFEAHRHERADAAASQFHLPRREQLETDLATLGAHCSLADEGEFGLGDSLEEVGGRLGCLYVLLGSQMGSAALERQVLAQVQGAPVAFFRCRFPELGKTWRAFRAFLNSGDLTTRDHILALQSANLTFQYFISRMR